MLPHIPCGSPDGLFPSERVNADDISKGSNNSLEINLDNIDVKLIVMSLET